MKKLIITVFVCTLFIGGVFAQDNKVKMVKQNTESLSSTNPQKESKKGQVIPTNKRDKSSMKKKEVNRDTPIKEIKVSSGKNIKPKRVKVMNIKPQKMKPVKKHKSTLEVKTKD